MSVVTLPVDGTAEHDRTLHPSTLAVIRAVTKRLVPYLIESTVIPSALFYVLLVTTELKWAFFGALGWSYTTVARRLVRRRPIPGLLQLATLGISLRTVLYLLSGRPFVYFLQPVLRTFVTAAVFALSVLAGRPLIARFASDFCPVSPEIAGRPAVVLLFRRLTYLWAAVNALAAGVTLTLLLTVPVTVFVGSRPCRRES